MRIIKQRKLGTADAQFAKHPSKGGEGLSERRGAASSSHFEKLIKNITRLKQPQWSSPFRGKSQTAPSIFDKSRRRKGGKRGNGKGEDLGVGEKMVQKGEEATTGGWGQEEKKGGRTTSKVRRWK